jgi:hypothetical protein
MDAPGSEGISHRRLAAGAAPVPVPVILDPAGTQRDRNLEMPRFISDQTERDTT